MQKQIVFFIFSFFILTSCESKKQESRILYVDELKTNTKILKFGVHPLHNPEKLVEVFGPLVDLFNQKIKGYQFKIEASRNYPAFEEKLAKRELDIALPNPYQAVKALKHGYVIFGKMGDDKEFRGLIVTRKDSPIKKISDLKGKKISYPAATALAATMMPQYFMYKNGLNVMKSAKNIYVGSQESSIFNALLKETDAACTWPPPWIAFTKKYPEKAAELEVRWQTPSLVNNALIIKSELSEQLRTEILGVLLKLNETEEGLKILSRMELTRFEGADEKTYKPVEEFIKKFSKELRAPEEEL